MLEYLEKEIVENGKLTIDSVFRFSKEPTELPAFLQMCHKKKCTVVFELEKLICEPDGDLHPEDTDTVEQLGGFFTSMLMCYMSMFNRYFGKHSEYLMNLASIKEGWAKGERIGIDCAKVHKRKEGMRKC